MDAAPAFLRLRLLVALNHKTDVKADALKTQVNGKNAVNSHKNYCYNNNNNNKKNSKE